MNKEELCKELGFENLSINKNDTFTDLTNTHNLLEDRFSMTYNNSRCYKCKNLKEKFDSINIHYNISGENRLESMIHAVSKSDNSTLKLFAIEIYNILNQSQSEYKDEIEFKSDSIKNMKTIKNMMSDFEFSKMITLTDNSEDSFENQMFKTVNNYILYEELGKGSQGTVYLAVDEKTNQKFAVKEILDVRKKSFVMSNNPLEKLKKEIAIMKNAEHENVVKLYDVIENVKENKIYLVMQYINGGSLLKKSQSDNKKYEPLPLNKVINYTKQLISGLRYLHHNNIIHRDIKPENILLDTNDKVYLSDFGVSDILKNITVPLTNKNGTVMFFSPEMFLLGAVVSGPEVDVWAFGVTIFLMLFGYFPFDGDNYDELQEKIINSPPNYQSNISDKEKDFFDKIFAKDQTARITLKDMKKHDFLNNHSYIKKYSDAINITKDL